MKEKSFPCQRSPVVDREKDENGRKSVTPEAVKALVSLQQDRTPGYDHRPSWSIIYMCKRVACYSEAAWTVPVWVGKRDYHATELPVWNVVPELATESQVDDVCHSHEDINGHYMPHFTCSRSICRVAGDWKSTYK